MRGSSSVLLLLCCVGIAAVGREADACTTFCLRRGSEAVFGKNYDWGIGDGLVVVNKRGVAKSALLPPGERAARWTSKYGSVTFNQYGREFPSGGMNEAGLVVELMWLEETRYPAPDGRPALGALEWIQYQLDNFASVAEVIRAGGRMRIVSEAPLHFLVCERSGRCAAIEFLDGKLVAHSGEKLPVPVLANSTYAESLRHLETQGVTGAQGPGSLARFARASQMIEAFPRKGGEGPVEHAFRILESVAQGSRTQWSIVYDLQARRVHWKTAANPRPRWVDLARFDFSCATPVRMLDVNGPGQGDIAVRFSEYRREKNRDLVVRAVQGTPFLAGMPPERIDETARQPERTTCTAGR